MKVRVGTSGFSYKEWKGYFYPEKIAAEEMLGFYANNFDTVEINSTFYRMPKESMLLNWADQVPENFSFVLKASRRISHQKALSQTQEELDYFFRTSSVLAHRLGPVLVQLPPYAGLNLDELDGFLDLVPGALRVAMEYRHQSWFVPDVYERLAARNVALVWADADNAKLEPEFTRTADWGYLRLRRDAYPTATLEQWGRRIQAERWDEAYVFFKHEDKGSGPRLAAALRDLLS